MTAGFAALGSVGIDKVRVDAIAKTLGVTKGSFYWHFKDRAEFLDAVVAKWETRGTTEIIEEVDAAGLQPEKRARRVWELATANGGMPGELAIRDWARRDPMIAARVQRVDDRRMLFLRGLFLDLGAAAEEIEPRSLLLYSLLMGDYLIATDCAGRARHDILTAALALVLKTSG